jgi:hypothetical protein
MLTIQLQEASYPWALTTNGDLFVLNVQLSTLHTRGVQQGGLRATIRPARPVGVLTIYLTRPVIIMRLHFSMVPGNFPVCLFLFLMWPAIRKCCTPLLQTLSTAITTYQVKYCKILSERCTYFTKVSVLDPSWTKTSGKKKSGLDSIFYASI